jgi:hypothetical protein
MQTCYSLAVEQRNFALSVVEDLGYSCLEKRKFEMWEGDFEE